MSQTAPNACLLSDLFHPLPAGEDVTVLAISQDSRKIEPGSLFLARAGANSHGLDFLDQVLAKGPAAIAAEPDSRWPVERIEALAAGLEIPLLVETDLGERCSAIAAEFYGQPSMALRVIGITGTNGKTSCSHAIAWAMDGVSAAAIVGTLGNGRPGQLDATSHTTPDAVEVQQLLARYRDSGVEMVSMEVSSHALEQGRVAAVRFDTAVFTNLSRDHLDYHQTMEAYAAAKARLFSYPALGSAVINGDDPFAKVLCNSLSDSSRQVIYGLGDLSAFAHKADRLVCARSVEAHSTGLRMEVSEGSHQAVLESRWLGRFNASNLLAVFAVLLEQGLPFGEALEALSGVPVVPGRMESFGGGDKPLVVVDYAHTPDALENVLLALRDHCQGELICLFGCGGDRDRGKRPLMGQVAATHADRLILTDDNPRTESGEAIVEAILSGIHAPEKVSVERDRAKAIRQAVESARSGDVVAICGKGHETIQTIGTEVHPFSDRQQVAELMAEALSC